MCQNDLPGRDVLTPFEECALDELTRGNPDTAAAQAARVYANRVARLALVLYELLEELDGEMLPPASRQLATQACEVLNQESEAAARGGAVTSCARCGHAPHRERCVEPVETTGSTEACCAYKGVEYAVTRTSYLGASSYDVRKVQR